MNQVDCKTWGMQQVHTKRKWLIDVWHGFEQSVIDDAIDQ